MHISKVRNQSWSGIPFDRTLYHWRQDPDDFWLALASCILSILHLKLLQAIFEIFFLRYEDVVVLLTDLETQKELQLAHPGHLILLLHHVTKLITVFLVGATEDNVIHIDLAHKQFTIICLREECGIEGSRFEAFALQEVFECVIPSMRGLFEAIQFLVELVYHIRMFWIFKARWLCNIHLFNLAI